ncbi:MAG: nicotinate-nucleotide adenylyltransferase [Prevotellaceae bacterium]|jgi:nicotinate-nucleotide adenylyltransferase|nr:nicotinate-nucleotide adenylyltransferase [Prevotellaceae bacterium]
MKQTGLFFGSFNPVHTGHLLIANYMRSFQALDEIWFVVTPQNPTKSPQALAAATHRLAMTQLAVKPYPAFHVCDIEFLLPSPTYTIHTLDALRECYPQRRFALLIGSDNWRQMPQWKDADRLCAEYRILVYPRFGFDLPERPARYPLLRFTDAPRIEISSTFIRQAVADGKDVACFTPAAVCEYMRSHKLYLPA